MDEYEYQTCPDCICYAERRSDVLPRAFADHIKKSGETSQEVLDRYMTGVHARHLLGLAI